MFSIVHPDHTLERTKVRLDRHGPTPAVIAANAFDWASLSLHQSLFYILGLTLAMAVLGRLGLTLLQVILLVPMAWMLAVRPALRAGRQTQRQLASHRQRHGVWKRDEEA